MLAIKADKTALERRCTPNILPCRINHNGPVVASERYWDPSAGDGRERRTSAAISFWERRSKSQRVIEVSFVASIGNGKALTTREGVVMSSTDKTLAQNSSKKGMPGDDPSDDEQPEEVKVMEEHASFDEIVVWGHEALPDASADPYVKSMEEWVEFAEQIHSFPPSADSGQEPGARR
ncbi:MAG: hypothetical protein M1840_003165 [Geoglossum simile]|nr:MAG: hypothetical protein M1840_003165 [Geoglossum simile]